MGKTYVFAIGGTGARVLRSLSMLMASGIPGINSTDEICPIIIDYDLTNADKIRALEVIKQYNHVRSFLNPAQGGEYSLFAGQFVNRLPKENEPFTWRFGIDDENQTFSEYIGYDKLASHNGKPTQFFLDTLYDTSKDEEYTELNINMRIGFQGNPNIGSVVFDKLKEMPEFLNFRQLFDVNTDRVVVIGSVFGGTGSSGVPQIIKAIKGESAPSTWQTKASVAVILVLPYFEVANHEGKAISVKSAIFNSKTKAALNYYEKSGIYSMVSNVYYVGDKMPMRVKPALGSHQQKNNAHVVELISAMAIADFINTKGTGKRFKTFHAAVETIDDGILLEQFVGYPTAMATAASNFAKETIHRLVNFTMAMRYYRDILAAGKADDSTFGKAFGLKGFSKTQASTPDANGKGNRFQDFCAALYDFSTMYVEWLKEMHDTENGGGHRLKFFDIDSQDVKDMIHGHPLAEKSNTLYSGAFESSMDNLFRDHHKSRGNVGHEAKHVPWAITDMLYRLGDYIRQFDADLQKRFELVP